MNISPVIITGFDASGCGTVAVVMFLLAKVFFLFFLTVGSFTVRVS